MEYTQLVTDDVLDDEALTPLISEMVSQGIQIRPGVYGTDRFWIVYPPSVLAYGHEEDRISRAWGSGTRRREALAEAQKKIADGWVVS